MTVDRALSEGKLVAGVSYDIPGMGFQNPQTGRIDGFEADLARALGEKLFGAPGHIELAQFTDDKRIEMLQADMVDMVLSQLTITPDRTEQVDFSIPYWVTREGVLVRKGSGIKGFDDRKGKHIAVTAGSGFATPHARHAPEGQAHRHDARHRQFQRDGEGRA